jgi:predicted metal-dependent hydrolase
LTASCTSFNTHWACTPPDSRIQGSKLKAKRDIKVAALFKDTPLAFLQMIAVHELAHLKVREHDKAFYKLCHHMAPDYAQYEFELRIISRTLTWVVRKSGSSN